jgi:hypothetical protein
MVTQHAVIAIGGKLTKIIALYVLCSQLSLVIAQSVLHITSPKDQTVFHPGQSVQVVVTSTGPVKGVFLIAPDLAPVKTLTSPPFEFRVDIPDDIQKSGAYMMTVDGYTESKVEVTSDAIVIDVERADSPLSLLVRPSDGASLERGDAYISPAGEQLWIDVKGSFSDGKTLNLNDSALTKISSNNPSVAVVQSNGRVHVVKTIAPGSAKLSITNGKAIAEIRLKIITRTAFFELQEQLFPPPEKQKEQ